MQEEERTDKNKGKRLHVGFTTQKKEPMGSRRWIAVVIALSFVGVWVSLMDSRSRLLL